MVPKHQYEPNNFFLVEDDTLVGKRKRWCLALKHISQDSIEGSWYLELTKDNWESLYKGMWPNLLWHNIENETLSITDPWLLNKCLTVEKQKKKALLNRSMIKNIEIMNSFAKNTKSKFILWQRLLQHTIVISKQNKGV